ncbi:hypothetical protein L227DRAFT_117802 [Lentinus tigrinus ALCF2SS1-6]|uniref:Uncharacterized protein n=1 Tax=Lentinus tigrinus ALCF2SS1-6 TaxID=1328759 RepID=A0A5C2S7V1_9APHY|nr:hypothetical protein L227DRAFT_117802 [Lentinus tigrinus ALCF2SS1-6]
MEAEGPLVRACLPVPSVDAHSRRTSVCRAPRSRKSGLFSGGRAHGACTYYNATKTVDARNSAQPSSDWRPFFHFRLQATYVTRGGSVSGQDRRRQCAHAHHRRGGASRALLSDDTGCASRLELSGAAGGGGGASGGATGYIHTETVCALPATMTERAPVALSAAALLRSADHLCGRVGKGLSDSGSVTIAICQLRLQRSSCKP